MARRRTIFERAERHFPGELSRKRREILVALPSREIEGGIDKPSTFALRATVDKKGLSPQDV